MKVLHFYRTAHPYTVGGIESVIHQIARGTQEFGVSVEVLCLSRRCDPPTVEIDGYLTHRVKLDFEIASTGFSLAAFSKFASLARQADLIHYHFPWPFMDLVHFATRPAKPTVVTYHSDIIRQKNALRLYRPLKRRFLNDVNHIVATSPNYLRTSDVLADHHDKCSVIPIGLDKSTYPHPSAEKLEQWRRRVGEKFFLFVGVMRHYKGLHILMEATKGIDFPIVIVGAGPVETGVRAQAKRLGLRNVHFLGLLPDEDKVALLQLCHGIVFPSHLRSEAFGVSLLEGAMYGKPMISCEIGTGTTFVNIGGETGLTVPPADPEALRQAMRHLWENPDEAAAMGRRAEQRYWRAFTAKQMVSAYVDLYRQLAGVPPYAAETPKAEAVSTRVG